jgi:hypothetical protein
MAGTTGSDRDPRKPGYALPRMVPRPPGRTAALGPQEVRPSFKGIGGTDLAKIAGAIAFVLIAIPVGLAGNGGQILDQLRIGLWVDLYLALIAAIVGALALLYFRNQRVGLAGGYLYRVRTFGGRRRWPVRDLAKVVRVKAISNTGLSSESMDVPTTAILDTDLIIDKRGRAVESFSGGWPQEAMTRLWEAAGLPIREPWPHPVSVQEIRKRYPGAVPTLPA